MNRFPRLLLVLLVLGLVFLASARPAHARAVNDLCFPYTPKNADEAVTAIHLHNPDAVSMSFTLNLFRPDGSHAFTYNGQIPPQSVHVVDLGQTPAVAAGSYHATVIAPAPLDGVAYVQDTDNETLGVYEGQECAQSTAVVQYFGPFFADAGGPPMSSLLLANSQGAPAAVTVEFLTASGSVGYSQAGISLAAHMRQRWDTAAIEAQGNFPGGLAWVRVSGSGAASVTGVIRQEDGNGFAMYHAVVAEMNAAVGAAGADAAARVFIPRLMLAPRRRAIPALPSPPSSLPATCPADPTPSTSASTTATARRARHPLSPHCRRMQPCSTTGSLSWPGPAWFQRLSARRGRLPPTAICR